LENASMPGRVVAQWDKDDCEELGIVKVDLLGLGMMSVMQDAFELCRERGRPLDLAHIPKNDEKTFDIMQHADTIGVFQIESRAQMATLPRMEPQRIAPDKIDKIIQSISSFALYGFPESHAISFAILAYGSAYLKVHRAPEFYASLLNNQPMGFYTPATIVKDAQRHGLKILP